MNFSSRTNWHRTHNRLAQLYDERKASGAPIFDLTITNPTLCGIAYPQQEILSALANPLLLQYHPDPRGIVSARESVVEYYKSKNVSVDQSNLFLTASTSESYSLIFNLLCEAGDSVLIPQPSYPLFEFLAKINDVNIFPYRLEYDNGWNIDFDSIMKSINAKTKAIIIINPHNPTGAFLERRELDAIHSLASQHDLALIVDEVFIDYPLDDSVASISTANNNEALTFTLNGISKLLGLPQMKLGWIVLSGEQKVKSEAIGRLEILCDTFLSVNAPVQAALPKLFGCGENVHHQILNRIRSNHAYLISRSHHESSVSYLPSEGGWYGIIRVPGIFSDEEWALALLQERGIHVHPGYFFDFEKEGFLVVSLLVEEALFKGAVTEIRNFVEKKSL